MQGTHVEMFLEIVRLFAEVWRSMHIGEVQKGTGEGDGKNSVINCRKTVVHCRDALWRFYDAFMSQEQSIGDVVKMPENPRKSVGNCGDIFCPVPFPLSPFNLHRAQSPRLSGSHRSTHIASDLASRELASRAKPQRESVPQAFRIAQFKIPQEPCHTQRYHGHSSSLRPLRNTTTVVKHYGRVSENPCFLEKNSQKISTNSKLLRWK